MEDEARRASLQEAQQEKFWSVLRETMTPLHNTSVITEFTNACPEGEPGKMYFRRRAVFTVDDEGSEAFVDVCVPAKHAVLAQGVVLAFPKAQRSMATCVIPTPELERRYKARCDALHKNPRTFVPWDPSDDLTQHLMHAEPIHNAPTTISPSSVASVTTTGPTFPPGIHHAPTHGQPMQVPGTSLTLTPYS